MEDMEAGRPEHEQREGERVDSVDSVQSVDHERAVKRLDNGWVQIYTEECECVGRVVGCVLASQWRRTIPTTCPTKPTTNG